MLNEKLRSYFKTLCVILVPFFAISCCELGLSEDCDEEVMGCTDFYSYNYNEQATTDDGSCQDMRGCLGYVTGQTRTATIVNSLDNIYYDQKFQEEFWVQQQFFNCCPSTLYVMLEPDPLYKNAVVPYNTSQIYFGYHMFYYTVSVYGELAAAGVLAHEFGHVMQNNFKWSDDNMYKELEADAWSGFYMAMAKQWAWSQINGYFANTYASGDYNFNSPAHHGTKEERLAAAQLGVLTAVEVLQSGIPKSFQELHQLFQTELQNNIAPRNGRITILDKIIYPEGITEEYVKSLYPFDERISGPLSLKKRSDRFERSDR
jgi:hypothetical protein